MTRADISPGESRRTRADWVGFVFFLALAGTYMGLAGTILLQSPAVGVLMLPTFLNELMTAIAFLIRRPLRQELSGWTPRLAAYAGTFILPAFLQTAGRWRTDWIAPSSGLAMQVGLVLWLFGAVVGLWTLWHLRRSFSLEPQARALVTSGPYRLARHPIYAAYILQYAGVWLAHTTVPLGVVLLAWLGITVVRIHFEEKVLEAAFPGYAQYRSSVGAFGPRI